MQTTRGKILDIDGVYARVRIDAAAACPRCAAGKGCGAALFTNGPRERVVAARLDRNLGVAAGDDVELQLRPARLLQASGLAYGLPLVGIVLGALAGAGFGEAASVVAAVAGLLFGLLAARWWLQRAHCLQDFAPRVSVRLEGPG